MPPTGRFPYLCFLLFLLLILPQCSDKKSDDYIGEGLMYMEQDKYQRAELSFKQAIDANPKDPNGYYHLGSIYNALKRYPEAIETLNKSIRLDPTHHDAYFSLAYALEQTEQVKESEKAYATYRRLKKKIDSLAEERRQQQ